MSALERLAAGGWRLADPGLLAVLWAVILLAAVCAAVGVVRRRALLRRSFGPLAAQVAPGASAGVGVTRAAIACGGLALLAVAAARPQAGVRSTEAPVPGVDLAVALDASASMLARDATPDRFEAARAAIRALLDRRPADRVAVVAFAGSAFVQAPLTSDHRAAALLLGAVDPASMPRQGTDIGAALDTALRTLAPTATGSAARVVLLVSDGEDHASGAAEAADRAALDGVVLLTAGAGSEEGARVPRPDGLGFVSGEGRPVISRLDETALSDLAARAGGRYVHLGTAAAVDELADALRRAERDGARTARVSAWDERFEPFAIAGILLVLASTAVPERGRRPRAPRPAPGRGARTGARSAAVACAALLLGASPFLAEHGGVAHANAVAARDPAAALALYEEAEREVGPRPEIDVDRGLALFHSGRIADARRSFALSLRSPPPLASRATFADGVAALALGDEAGAIGAWRRALVLDPSNGAARHDLEVLLRRRAERRPPPASSGGDARQPEGGEEARGSAAEPQRRGDTGAGEALRARPDETRGAPLTPMSREAAGRLLDEAAARERVIPAASSAPRQPPSTRPW